MNHVLCLNAGSASLKFGLYRLDSKGDLLRCQFRGAVDRRDNHLHFRVAEANGAVLDEARWDTDPGAGAMVEIILGWAEAHLGGGALAAVGHRVVHGGVDFDGPVLVNAAVMRKLDALSALAPLHQPVNLATIRNVAALPQVACFDTAFHHTMPEIATRFGLPRALHDRGIRRYGFHGLSYDYVAGRLAQIAPGLAEGRVIIAHLGSGASLCATLAGHSIETTMGFTATDGLLMGTRCGALDPGVVLSLIRSDGMSAEAVEDLLNRQSGLLGVSGLSSDMRVLLASDAAPAREAVDLFVYRVVRETAALAAALGGLDGLVFTGGIGEHAAPVRASVVQRLGWLGCTLDPAANAGVREGSIAALGSRVAVHVVPTDEEVTIARQCGTVLRS